MEIVVVVKCMACGTTRDIRAGEVKSDDVPMCQKCFTPMFPVKATSKPKHNQEL